jgi:hypothetical protein
MDLSNVSSWLIYGVLLVLCFIVVYFFGYVIGGRKARQSRAPVPPPPPPPRKSLIGGTIKLLIMLVLIASALALLFYTALLRSYHAFTGKQLVAIVYCQPIQDRDFDFELTLIPIVNETPQDTNKFVLRGDQWALEGNILKWKNYMTFLGLKTMYKLTRIRGRHLNARRESVEPKSVYALADEERAKKWKWLYKYGHRLPMVDSAYGNEVHHYPIPNRYLRVFVTTSGFMIEG